MLSCASITDASESAAPVPDDLEDIQMKIDMVVYSTYAFLAPNCRSHKTAACVRPDHKPTILTPQLSNHWQACLLTAELVVLPSSNITQYKVFGSNRIDDGAIFVKVEPRNAQTILY